jgi:hypothetical protein
MMIRKLTHLTFLTTLACQHINPTYASDLQTSLSKQPSGKIQIDSPLLPALLPSMSRLIESPYKDSSALDNPLGIKHPVAAKSEVIKAVLAKDPQATTEAKPLHDSLKPAGESSIIPLPRARDFSLTAPLNFSASRTDLPFATEIKGTLAGIVTSR